MEDLKSGSMTTYAKTLAAQPDRKRKKEVRDFLFSLFTHLQLNRIVGLAGPHIEDYIEFCKSKGYTEFEIYEMDKLTAIHQLIHLNNSVQLKLKNILEANPEQPGTLYDLDYCVTGRHMGDHMMKFKHNFIMTFSGRVSLKETMDRFFTVRQEKVIDMVVKKYPLAHTEYFTNKGKYVQLTYRDTSPMFCIAKIA